MDIQSIKSALVERAKLSDRLTKTDNFIQSAFEGLLDEMENQVGNNGNGMLTAEIVNQPFEGYPKRGWPEKILFVLKNAGETGLTSREIITSLKEAEGPTGQVSEASIHSFLTEMRRRKANIPGFDAILGEKSEYRHFYRG